MDDDTLTIDELEDLSNGLARLIHSYRIRGVEIERLNRLLDEVRQDVMERTGA